MEKSKISKSEGIILILSDLLKQLSEKDVISDFLKEYYLLENTYIGLIKKQQFGTIITQKNFIHYFLHTTIILQIQRKFLIE